MDAGAMLSQLRMVFQPIVRLESVNIIGYEALARGPRHSRWELPNALFLMATQAGLEQEIEHACRRIGLDLGSRLLPPEAHLFVNVNTQIEPMSLPVPTRFVAHPEQLGIEVSEQHPILGQTNLLRQVKSWRDHGYQIVLDDFGTGYAQNAVLVDSNPTSSRLIANLSVASTRIPDARPS